MSDATPPKLNQLAGAFTKVSDALYRLSRRERYILASAVFVVLLIGADNVYESISTSFAELTQSRQKLEMEMKSVSVILDRYARLKKKKEAVQARYQKFEISEGVLSYLERLVKDKAGAQPGKYKITSGKERAFGGNYVQVPFRIKIETTELKLLVAFLDELVHGKQPLILTELDIQKNLVSNSLTVEIDVSSMREESAQGDDSGAAT